MNFHKHRLIHWIAAFAIAMSALAPAISQAASLAQHGQGFAMEICSADGGMMQINVLIHHAQMLFPVHLNVVISRPILLMLLF